MLQFDVILKRLVLPAIVCNAKGKISENFGTVCHTDTYLTHSGNDGLFGLNQQFLGSKFNLKHSLT